MNSFLYPLRFHPIYFEKIWGGRDFSLFRDNLPEGNIGESWDVACHAHGISEVYNGVFKGLKLDYLIRLLPEEILGTDIVKSDSERFPLLVKLINSKESLSVQVHPNDEYSKKYEGESGKTEVWYVIEAAEGAELVLGTKQCTKEEFAAAIYQGTLEKYLNKIKVAKGDAFLIESGLVHAIGEGIVIVEIQQNSDVTYRVYDYNRGRKLNVKQALEVANLNLESANLSVVDDKYGGWSSTTICNCSHFTLQLYCVDGEFEDSSCQERFHIITCVDGNGNIKAGEFEEKLRKGDSLLIPAAMGEYKIHGTLKYLKSYVP